ncbi:MAG: hypothetical protein ACYC4U_25510 [Pirellulaceae bacterium]
MAKIRKILLAGAKTGEYISTAVVSNVQVRFNETGEVMAAIRVEVEHAKDEPITCMLPYRKKDKGVEQHIDPHLEPGGRVVFC